MGLWKAAYKEFVPVTGAQKLGRVRCVADQADQGSQPDRGTQRRYPPPKNHEFSHKSEKGP